MRSPSGTDMRQFAVESDQRDRYNYRVKYRPEHTDCADVNSPCRLHWHPLWIYIYIPFYFSFLNLVNNVDVANWPDKRIFRPEAVSYRCLYAARRQLFLHQQFMDSNDAVRVARPNLAWREQTEYKEAVRQGWSLAAVNCAYPA